jgi:hypothetical protein
MGRQADTASYYWTTFLRPNPKLATAFSHGLAYEGRGRCDRAVADHNEAIRPNPSGATPLPSRNGETESQQAQDRACAGECLRRILGMF